MNNLSNLPKPPPSAHPVQLELWRRVLFRRYRQIEALSPSTFTSFANDVASDYEQCLREISSSEMDLSKSHYSKFLLSTTVGGKNKNNTAHQIAFHFLALFYTAIDERITPPERQYALEVVKRSFSLLDDVLKGEGRTDNNNITGKRGRDEQEEEDERDEHDAAEMPKKKHARKDDSPRINDSRDAEMVDNGGIQNSHTDRSSEEDKEHEREKSNNIMSTVEAGEGGGIVANSHGPSASIAQPHESDEGTADIMHVDGSNDQLETATQRNEPGKTTEDNVGGEGDKTPSNISRPVMPQNQGDGGADDETEYAEPLPRRDLDNSIAETNETGPLPSKERDNSVEESVVADENETEDAEPLPRWNLDNSIAETNETGLLPSKERDLSVEESVVADENAAKPAESGAIRNEAQLNGEAANTDEVVETESASSHFSGPSNETDDEGTINVMEPALEAAGAKPIDQTPLPPPRVYSGMRHLNFYADTFVPCENDPEKQILVSGSLHPRGPCTVQYDTGYQLLNYCATLDDETSLSINNRLAKWDPYWKIVDVLCRRDTVTDIGQPTKVSTKTASCKDETGVSNPPSSCAMVTVDLAKEGRNSTSAASTTNEDISRVWGVEWGNRNKEYKSGDRRLLLRTLPLTRSSRESTKRADCHLWPKGTFIQLKIGDEVKERVVKISQRQQQRHEPKKWKGQSEVLDLTPHVHNTALPIDVKLCCREAVRKQELPSYGMGTEVVKFFEDETGEQRPFHGVVQSYDSTSKYYRILYEDEDEEDLLRDEVSEILVTKVDHGTEDPPTVGSYAIHVAICEYADPGRLFDELTGKRVGKFVIPAQSLESVKQKFIQSLKQRTASNVGHAISLRCPIGKTVIETPVRGRDCDHLQCFDLRNFLHANKNPSSGRWRCGVCQSFLCCEDLVRCGLFDEMLRDLQTDTSSTRHKVSFDTSGRWKLIEQQKVEVAKAEAEIPVNREPRSEPEVIDLS